MNDEQEQGVPLGTGSPAGAASAFGDVRHCHKCGEEAFSRDLCLRHWSQSDDPLGAVM